MIEIMSDVTENLRPLIFGEVLFDVFDNADAKLGGAPFNVAWHLKGFGEDPIFVSRVGDDKNGEIVSETMQKWGMDLSGLQIDKEYSTGVVDVSLKDAQATFNIPDKQAYDFIGGSPFLRSLTGKTVSTIYHGSLALRSKINFDTLSDLKTRLNPFVFSDVNLRSPWWELSAVKRVISESNAVKLNDDELCKIVGVDSLSGEEMLLRAQNLCNEYNLEFVIVTKGKDGSSIVEKNGNRLNVTQVEVSSLIDTVGAGDSFSSVVILGILKKWDLLDTIKYASEFASKICSVRGALLSDKKLYSDLLQKWRKEK